MALIASCFIQIGAQLFAVSIMASTIAEAPPRSFAILQGEHGYNSQAFWDIVPNITFVLFMIALAANWRTARRKMIFAAMGLFVAAGLLAIFVVGPRFDALIAGGFREDVDPLLQSQAAAWLTLDWTVWGIGLISGLLLLLAVVSPIDSSK